MFPETRWVVRQASAMLLAAWLTTPAVAQSLASVTVSASQASPVSGAVTVTASVSPTTGLTGVQFKLDSYVLEALVRRLPAPQAMRVWSLPRVFHTCGKNCGNSRKSMAKIYRIVFFGAQ